jgi:CheY-like chemotaxis protein
VKQPIRLVPLIEENVRLALRGTRITSSIELPEDLWPVEADEGQVGQVLSNIIINAAQAMPNGGTLRVRACNVAELESSVEGPAAGSFVQVSIQDDGAGIPPDLLSRIFDPYFTTKPTGTGLGLAVAHAVVRNHGGRLLVDSAVGKGTTFHIYLPRSAQQPLGSVRVDRSGVAPRTLRLLLMDDDPMVRKVTAAILSRAGYRCEAASEGREAIEYFEAARRRGEPFDGVILDLTVQGGMGGEEALVHLRRLDESIPALVLSGYADSDILAEFGRYGFSARLAKPFASGELVNTVREMLARSGSDTPPVERPPAERPPGGPSPRHPRNDAAPRLALADTIDDGPSAIPRRESA